MKLTQELIVTIVFLIGSWVVLSVVAVAFPPSASSIRQALNKHASTSKSEPVIGPEAIAEPATTYYQEEKVPVVQVVSGDPQKNEIFILAENDPVPEKMIEENPEAKLAVLGGDEETMNRHIEKFNIAAKNVAIKLALAKETLIRQAEADNRKLQEWKEWTERKGFALETQSKKFELPIEKLNHNLKQVAEQPYVVLPDTGLESPVDDAKAHARLKVKKKQIQEAQLSGWNQAQLETAMKFVAADKAKYAVCKQTVEAKIKPTKQTVKAAFENAAKVAEAAPSAKAVPTIKVVPVTVAKAAVTEEPRLEVLHEQFRLAVKDKSYHLTGLQELSPSLAALAAEQAHVVAAKPIQVAEQTVKALPVAAPAAQQASNKLALKARVMSQDKLAQPVKVDNAVKARAVAQAKQVSIQPVKSVVPVVSASVAAVTKSQPAAVTASVPVVAAAAPASAPLTQPALPVVAGPVAVPVAVTASMQTQVPAMTPALPLAPVSALAVASIQPQLLPSAPVQAQVKTETVTPAEAPVVTIVKGPLMAEAKSQPKVKAKANEVFKPVIKRFVPDQVVAKAGQNSFAKRTNANTKAKVTPVNYTADQLAAIEQAKAAKREKLVKRERALRNLEKQLETEPMNISQPQVAERKVDAPVQARAATHQAERHPRYEERPMPAAVARRQQPREERSMHHDNSNDFNDDFQSSEIASNRDRAWEYETYGYAREFSNAEEYSNLMQD